MTTTSVEQRRRLVRALKVRGWSRSRMAATLETSVRTVTTDLARIAEEDRARAVGHQTALDDAQDVFRLVRQKAWGAAEAAAAATRHPQVVRFMRVVVRATRAQLRLLKQAGGATKLQ